MWAVSVALGILGRFKAISPSSIHRLLRCCLRRLYTGLRATAVAFYYPVHLEVRLVSATEMGEHTSL